MGTEPVDFCREIEDYLCKKNDGHLIRVTGPSFDLVSRWAAQGVPLKVAFAGIDRYFERYYRKGPRRRPIRIDFCEADVLDVFDDWRRAVGIAGARVSDALETPGTPEVASRGPSLPAHLERALMKLTSARAAGRLDDRFDPLIDRVNLELGAARTSGGIRGDARKALIERLSAVDEDLVRQATDLLTVDERANLTREATDELASFRERMSREAFARACDGALARLIRERFGLPTLTFV